MTKSFWKNPWMWIIIILVVILLVLIFIPSLWQRHPKSVQVSQTGQLQIHQGLPTGYKTQPVAVGKLPQGFPAQLVLYKNVTPSRGEVTNPGTGVTHYITEFTVPGTIAVAYNTYVSGLDKQGWKVSSSQVNEAYMDIVLTKTASSTPTQNLEFTATPGGQGSRIRLDYYESAAQ